MASFFENAMYGVLYGYTPEVFPTPHRGTGDAFAAAANRITGLFAPIIAVYSQVCVSIWILASDLSKYSLASVLWIMVSIGL